MMYISAIGSAKETPMVRTQLMLDERHHRTLKRLSRERGKSISALVREMLDAGLAAEQPRLGRLAGILEDAPQVAREHDRVVYTPTTKAKRR
jgi:hypothetical protein